jgi:tetratricopeptide (TPR) repeat protein
VLDKLIQAFQLEAPVLTKDPLGYFAQSLEDSLPKDEASDGGSDIYAIRNVIERVKKAKQREDQAQLETGVTPTESKLGAVRDALRRAEYREAIHKARQMELEALSIKELDELADAMWSAAVGLFDKSEEELVGYELVSKIRDLHSRKAAQTLAMKEQEAMALVNKAIRLSGLNRIEESIATSDSVVQQFGNAIEPTLRHQVGKALFAKAAGFGDLDRNEESITTYDHLDKQFGADPELSQKELVAKSLVNKGVRFHALKRTEKAIESYEEVVRRYGTASELSLRKQVAMALNNKGNRLSSVHRSEEAIAAYDETVRRFGEAEESELRLRVARALSFKSLVLQDLSRSEEAMATYDELIRRYSKATEPEIQQIIEETRTSLPLRN